MRYFPLTSDLFSQTIGVRALAADENLIEVTEHYHEEIKLKRQLLDSRRQEYASLPADTLDAQFEAVAFLIEHCDHLCNGHNQLLAEPIDLSSDPMLTLATHLQEDLVILANDPQANYPVIGGVVCFPSGWSLPEKMGRGIVQVHQPVPSFKPLLASPTEQLLDRLKVGRSVWRMNWGIRPTKQLDQSPRHSGFLAQQSALVNDEYAGARCFLRVERQTLTRLPKTGNILFTIHTHQSPLNSLSADQKQKLTGTLQSCPAETLAYKGLDMILAVVLRYLQK